MRRCLTEYICGKSPVWVVEYENIDPIGYNHSDTTDIIVSILGRLMGNIDPIGYNYSDTTDSICIQYRVASLILLAGR